jgi:thioredoxin-like negative regulator of GroEL
VIGSWLGAAALCAEPLAPALPDAGAPGSHALFLEYADGAEQRTLDALVRRYDAYVAAHPADITAQVERARFLEQAGCHEDEECPYWDEYERSLGQLRQRFSGNAEVELYLLGELWGDDGVARAKELLDAAEGWDAAQRARLHARLIELADSDDAAEILEHFRSASALDPALDLTLEGARALVALHRPQEAIRTLTSQLEAGEPPRKLEKIRLLADLEAYREADEALASLPSSDEHRLLQAKLWLGLGRVDDARRALAEARAASTWDGQTLDIEARQFELELRHGDEASASAAYAALRNGGFRRDPLLKQRVRLALRFPTLGWQLRDLLGALALLGFFAVCALAPLLVLLPIHYAGLVRGRCPSPRRGSFAMRGAHSRCSAPLISRSSTWRASPSAC